MAKGKVKVVTGKGYGFIETPESEKDIFYHESTLQGIKLNVGDEVEFDIEETDKGKNAVNIKVIK